MLIFEKKKTLKKVLRRTTGIKPQQYKNLRSLSVFSKVLFFVDLQRELQTSSPSCLCILSVYGLKRSDCPGVEVYNFFKYKSQKSVLLNEIFVNTDKRSVQFYLQCRLRLTHEEMLCCFYGLQNIVFWHINSFLSLLSEKTLVDVIKIRHSMLCTPSRKDQSHHLYFYWLVNFQLDILHFIIITSSHIYIKTVSCKEVGQY